ncbi:hypothetical protein PROFUN_05229 [Planoprotostelium fungivorum]|uniref:Heme haloperoxidase family profile domain-containing protein n=1 Tax=Planoprotostelium fungivorum TaxID=1890364 RepID=A0A2P6NRL8_9EUKA|nr:hypothetical protein PROFUN_05229 [Planoprotostelium fungivorum]
MNKALVFAFVALFALASAYPKDRNGKFIIDPSKHDYIAPGPNDVRAPCPALNTLANHGHLPRNGKNITKTDLIYGLFNGLNVGRDIGFILAEGAFKKFDNPAVLDLEMLQKHNAIEHDASMTRNDNALGDSTVVNATLLDALIASSADGKVLNWRDMVAHRLRRQADSVERNPTFVWNEAQKEAAAGEVAIFQLVFGSWWSGVEIATADSILRHERFPDGWKPHEGTVLLADVLPLTALVRLKI